MPPKIDRENIKKPVEIPPKLSEAAVATWERSGALSGEEQEKAQIRSVEIAETVYDFGGLKDLLSSVYEAAPLVELMERLNSSDENKAKLALDVLSNYTSDNQQDVDYVRAISGDMLSINAFIDRHLQEGGDTSSKIPLKDVLELVSDTVSEDVDNPEGVNIESILIAAASAYNTLRNAKDMPDAEVLRAVYAVENFFSPLLEIIGYDAFAMALRRESTLQRMTRQEDVGFSEIDVQHAQNEIIQAGLDEPGKVPAIVAEMMRRLFSCRDAEVSSVLHNITGHGVQFGTGRIIGEEDNENSLFEVEDDNLRFTWRVKTDVSIAKKNARGPEQFCSDILGVTVIVPTYEVLAEKMTAAIGFLSDSVSSVAKPSTDRDSHIHVKGVDVLNALLPVLGENLGDSKTEWTIDKKESTNGHQVGKITMLYQPDKSSPAIPVEIQFQTADDREISRAGEAAHALKDQGYKVSSEDLRIIKRLHERRMMTTVPSLTEHSKQRAGKLFSEQRVSTVSAIAVTGLNSSSMKP